MLTPAEVFEVLHAIERGELTVELIGERRWGIGDTDYRCSNGWVLTVFDDCGEWDYLAAVTTPEGRVDFWAALRDGGRIDDDGGWEDVRNYRPPGYLVHGGGDCERIWGLR